MKILSQGAIAIKPVGNRAQADKRLEQALAMEKAVCSGTYHTEASPRLRELGLVSAGCSDPINQ